MSVTRSTPIGWSDALLESLLLGFTLAFTASSGGSIKNDGLLVSSRAVKNFDRRSLWHPATQSKSLIPRAQVPFAPAHRL